MRCTKAHRQCICTQRRPNRRNTSNTDILDLEKKIGALISSLETIKTRTKEDDDESDEEEPQNTECSPEVGVNGAGAFVLALANRRENGPINYVDVLDEHILTWGDACYIFEYFVSNMLPLLPILVFPTGTTLADI